MRSRLLAVSAVLVAVVAVAVACQTTEGVTGAATNVAADVVLPPSQEEQLGAQFSNQVEREMDLHDNPQVQAYIATLGNAAVQAAGDDAPDPIEFEFHVVDDSDTVNAFAGPGGQIYFFSGLLLEADNAAEVMGVMAHEVAHVTKRHVAERLATSYGLQALASAALGDNPGLLTQLASSITAQGFMLKYSRDQERQADDVGFTYVTDTSYDPVGMVSFFRKLGGGGGAPVFLSSHPSPEQRVDYLTDSLEAYGDPADDFLGEEEHAEIVELLEEGRQDDQQPRASD